MSATQPAEAHFGGPDHAAGRLRDLLAERVEAVPPGGSIDWVTYYFRDRRLAEGLVQARRRGVHVRVTLEGRPRASRANDRVVEMLAPASGLGEGLRTLVHRLPASQHEPRLHEKLFCFSHPEPVAFVGSFNPAVDAPEADPDIARAIGDQDRGHNHLVALGDRALVDALVRHARLMNRGRHDVSERLRPALNRPLRGGDLEVHFWPRVWGDPLVARLRRVGRSARVRIAASHVGERAAAQLFGGLAARGLGVQVLGDASQRRIPRAVERACGRAGVDFRRVENTAGGPMHEKFVLIEDEGLRSVVFGSYNWTRSSQLLNHEIAVISRDRKLYDAFAERWDSIAARAAQRTACPDPSQP